MAERASWTTASEIAFVNLMENSLDNCMSRNIVRSDFWSDQGDIITNYSFHHKPGGTRQPSVYVKKYNGDAPSRYEIGNRVDKVNWQGDDLEYPTKKILEHKTKRLETMRDLDELMCEYYKGGLSHYALAMACAETLRRITDHPYHRMYLWDGDAVPIAQAIFFRDRRQSFHIWTYSSENCVTQRSFSYVFEEQVERSLWSQRHRIVLADGRELVQFGNFRDLYAYAAQCNGPPARAVG